MKFTRKFAAAGAVLAMLLSACSSTSSPSASAGAGGGGSAAGCTIGMSWNNYQEERWAKWDEPAIKSTIEAAGGKYIANDAKSSAETQATSVGNLTSQGAKVLLILAQDDKAIKPSVAAAISRGIPVVSYDRLIEDPGVFYVTFDNVEVGRMQAREIFKLVPKGNYVFIKGNKADANAVFLKGGQDEILKDAVASGAIKNVGETFTDGWLPANAQTEMEQFLTANNNKVDAALSANDGMAGGVVAALTAQGLAGKVPVSGQDGDAAALNRVALGTQAVDVWKDARQLGKTAGEAAIQLCANKDVSKVANASSFTTPGNTKVSSILLKPQPITKANLQVVLDAKWIAKDKLCQGVTAGSVPGC